MIEITATTAIGMEEIHWQFSRSGGPGGQNVNKVSTRVTLIFNVAVSRYLDESQKSLILKRLGNQINHNGELRIDVDQERSQIRNREVAIHRFQEKLRLALKRQKARKKTRVPRSVREARLNTKKHRSKTKERRKKTHPPEDGY